MFGAPARADRLAGILVDHAASFVAERIRIHLIDDFAMRHDLQTVANTHRNVDALFDEQ
jgi:hypothetical protein